MASPILLDSIAQLSQPQLPNKAKAELSRSFQPVEMEMPQLSQPLETMKKSQSASISSKKKAKPTDLSSHLTKLNDKNDSLRKELMSISAELSEKLKGKKFIPKVKAIHERKEMSK